MKTISNARFESRFRAVTGVGNKWNVIDMKECDFVRQGVSKTTAYKIAKELNK
jgi:hypothetical protein